MNDDNDDAFRSITGALQSAEPSPALAASTTTPPTMASTRASSANRAPPPGPASEGGPAVPTRHQTDNGVRSLNASASPSTTTSPRSSRGTSPTRPSQRGPASAGPLPKPGLRSRKSSADASPSRGPSLAGPSNTVPSAAAIQRALSAANIPQLPPASSQDPPRAPRPLKPASGTNSGDTTPHWPISPRLKSPPPTTDSRSRSRKNSLRTQPKKVESPSTPSIIVQSSSPAPASRIPVRDEMVNSDPDEPTLSMKPSTRGASGAAPKLETVQESSLPTTPGFDELDVQIPPSAAEDPKHDEERNDVTSSKVTEDLSASSTKHAESGSDGGLQNDRNRMQEPRSASSQRTNTLHSKPSISSLSTIKSRSESRNMTVETETVPSVAQATLGNQERSASGRGDGSLRLKPSNETIRPKKVNKLPKRKAQSINAGTGRSSRISFNHYHPSRPDVGPRSTTTTSLGSPLSHHSYDDRRSISTLSPPTPDIATPKQPTRSPSSLYFYSATNVSHQKASSKADVFEQKVASAVDENSSDSDATFIYESNPPEQQPHRSRHHHSRTPSMTSIVSLIDPRTAIRDTHKNPGKKASMKFANPYNNPNVDSDATERGEGTIRIGSGRVSGGSHHHHISRHGQGRGALNHVVADSDSSIAQPSRIRGASSRHPSQPSSPRFHTFNMGNGNGNGTVNGHGNRKQGEFSVYDIDTEHTADDERTPLITTLRSPRVRTPRRRDSITLRHLERRHRRSDGRCRQCSGALALFVLVLLIVFMFLGLLYATTKPLTNVEVCAIRNVIASQEELMLDLVVDAENPNIVGITVADMDVNIFAKSKHVGSDRWWREHGNGDHHNEEDWNPIKAANSDIEAVIPIVPGGIDEGTDPIDDPEAGEPRTMLLGRIFHFDSPLNFDGTFFNRHRVESLGEMRLSKPGNKTEAGGTERWEEVLQYPFELIVRGVFQYQIPLSTQAHKVPITASYFYDPDMEKKKFKAIGPSERKRRIEPTPKPVTSKPVGRFDIRGRPLPLSKLH
ncbi:vacuolar segregation subunit 7-domain-containing protein [Massariosphaeria phaeospora]|uniref:Vacuolar segregation subunit 7-domain-containing protein n=1 Tax=Massariosphaeria phaeospora TaxID=100035 RepID=A0A7C8MM38_9PLEO|nr:vacuolar segregation subunit 7-domain-containing protein [Massariosphaeria phaeospora]